jgi:glycerol kinase
MQVGFYPSMDEFSESWQSESQFNSKMKEELRARKLAGWKDAVRRTLSNN